jgi:hypothetical protein
MVRDLGRETPEADAGRLAAGRAALMAEAGRGPRRKRIAYGLAAVGLAAAITGVLVLPEPPSTPELQMLPASQVLELAATAALAEPDVTPRPDQFFYTKSVGPDGKPMHESWRSMDGTRDGEMINYQQGETDRFKLDGCVGGSEDNIPEQGGGCNSDPAYLPNLPSDVEGILAYLRKRNTQESADVRTNSTAKDIWYLSSGHYLRSAQRAALYRAAAKIPGLRAVEGAKDAAGRKGTGIAWTYADGPEMMWIFDPKTHTFLGTPTETSTSAIVDKVGERP